MNMDYSTRQAALNSMFDVIRICNAHGTVYSSVSVYRDPQDTFVATFGDSSVMVNRISNEDRGECLLLVMFEEDGYDVKVFEEGFWQEYLKEELESL